MNVTSYQIIPFIFCSDFRSEKRAKRNSGGSGGPMDETRMSKDSINSDQSKEEIGEM